VADWDSHRITSRFAAESQCRSLASSEMEVAVFVVLHASMLCSVLPRARGAFVGAEVGGTAEAGSAGWGPPLSSARPRQHADLQPSELPAKFVCVCSPRIETRPAGFYRV
jgi:hypothetical protein